MISTEVKYAIIDNRHYNTAGYGSALAPDNDARLKDGAITIKFVQGWFDGNVINRTQPAGRNSFVARGPGYQYEVELFHLSD